MGNRMITRRVAGVLAALTVGSSAALLAAGPAHADDSRANIVGWSTSNVSVASQGCRNVPTTMRVAYSEEMVWYDIGTDVWRGDAFVDYWFPYANEPDNWYWCRSDGFGTFRFGPSDVWASDAEGYSVVDTVDYTYGYVKVKQRSSTATTSASRSGSYVTVSTRSSYYSYDSAAWKRWRYATVKIQYRLSGASTWHTAATVTANSYGNASKKVYAASGRYWRAVTSESAGRFGSTSGQVWK